MQPASDAMSSKMIDGTFVMLMYQINAGMCANSVVHLPAITRIFKIVFTLM